MEASDVDALNVRFLDRKEKPLFEFEGRIDDMDDGQSDKDENVLQAIELRQQRQKHTDFFYKLHELKERLEVYNEVFRSKIPRFLKSETY